MASTPGQLISSHNQFISSQNIPQPLLQHSIRLDQSTHPLIRPANRNYLHILTALACITLLVSLSFGTIFLHNTSLLLQRWSTSLPLQPPHSLPPILWIYTENQIQPEGVMEEVLINYYIQKAHQFHYEVRLINSWNTYDWLTERTAQKITAAMHNTKLDQGVNTLLKLAVLHEHGGILLSRFDLLIVGEDFQWLQDLFHDDYHDYHDLYTCKPEQSEVYMLEERGGELGVRYDDGLIAAVPKSKLVGQALDICIDMMLFGHLPENDEFHFIQVARMNHALSTTSSLPTSVFLALLRRSRSPAYNDSSCLGMQGLTAKNTVGLEHFGKVEQTAILNSADQRRILLESNVQLVSVKTVWRRILGYLYRLLEGKQNPADLVPGSIMLEIITAPKNIDIFIKPLPQRQIDFCVILLQPVSPEIIEFTLVQLQQQNHPHWHLVTPISLKDQTRDYIYSDSASNRLLLMPTRNNQVHDIERAATKYCHPRAYALLLNPGETLSHPLALTRIAESLQPRTTAAAFIQLSFQGTQIQVNPQARSFQRNRYGIVDPDIPLMNSILNHMRIFSIQTFRYLPQFDLRDIHGQYFKDRIIFLMTIIELVADPFTDMRMQYIARKYADVWNVPSSIAVIGSDTAIHISDKETVDLQQIAKTRTRISCESIVQTMKNLFKYKIPFSKILVFNHGKEFYPVEEQYGDDLIPNIIHQVWLGTNDLPPAKAYFVQKTKKMYPLYEVKLWRENNITRENFPLTYDILQNLLEHNRNSPYNKLATVTDIMRHQLMYREGGFWKDAGMNLLRPVFDLFRKYKLVLAVDKTFRHRWLQGMCFFANIPNLPNMWRITNFRNLNRMKVYSTDALAIAGPIDFRQLIVRQQQYNPQFLLMPYQTFYPGQIGQHPEGDICTKKQEDLQANEKYLFVQNGWYLLAKCAQLYPYAYAIEHNRFGNTWQMRKTDYEDEQ